MVFTSVSGATREDLQERADFDRACRKGTIEAFARFIHRHPRGDSVDGAVEAIRTKLRQEFSWPKFNASIAGDHLKHRMLAAIREDRPLPLAISPREVCGKDSSGWTVDFFELGGKGLKFDEMIPTVNTGKDGIWRIRNDAFQEPIRIPAFGRARFRFSFSPHPWRGSVVVLAFCGSCEDEQSAVKVNAWTGLSEPSARGRRR